ncbi:MAG TPA: hypothetical protein VLL77_13555 [Anaerolineales bacterium]|nr:hypothetical protein [Anaerolineales bacterium]
MNASETKALRRRRVQAGALAIILVGSALEALAVGAGLPVLRDILLVVVGSAMAVVTAFG